MTTRLSAIIRVLLLGALLAVAARAEEPRKNYEIPAGDAAQTLKQFAQISGRETLFAAEVVRGVKTRPVKGSLTAREALEALLADTGLRATADARTGAFAVRRNDGDPAPNAPRAAQTDGDRPTSQATKGEDGQIALEEFEVTGSRIRTLGQEQGALPVFSIPQIELERRGVNRLADIRWAIPQLGAAIGFNDNLLNGGTSRAQQVGTSFNLRGLGGNSTLVLVDGRRIPHTGQEAPGGAGGREDFSVDGIPVSAIERIEILPEGAGAIYGSEAIAGVVNIILKKNYSGAEVRISYDNTFDSDVGQTTVSLTAGHRAGKLSTFVTASYENQNGLASRDRWFSASADPRVYGGTNAAFFLSQPAGGPGSLASSSQPQNPNQVILPGTSTNVVGIPVGSNGTTAANAAFTTPAAPFDPNRYSMSIDPAERISFNLNAEYAARPWARVYVEGRASRFENDFVSPPVTLTFTTLPVGYPGNPFPDINPATPAADGVVLRKVFYDCRAPARSRRWKTSASPWVSAAIFSSAGGMTPASPGRATS